MGKFIPLLVLPAKPIVLALTGYELCYLECHSFSKIFFSDQNSCAELVPTFLWSVLYGILVWGSCSPALIDDLERAHIRASKLIRNSKADQLNKLKVWNNLSLFYTQRLLVEAYKSHNRCNTNALNDLVMLKQSWHCLGKSMNIKS